MKEVISSICFKSLKGELMSADYGAAQNVYYRKVQVVGKTTFSISLPKEWIKLMGIKPGSLLILKVDPSGFLIIEPPSKKRRERRIAKVKLYPNDIGRTIRESVSAYIAGYDEIDISFDEKHRETALRLRRLLEEIVLGLSLLEETPNTMKFYTVINPQSIRFIDVLKKECRVANSMLNDILIACEKFDPEMLKSVIERDQLVDKLYILALRQLTGALLGELKLSELELKTIAETIHIFIAIKSIERIADHATIISSELLQIGLKVCKKSLWITAVLSQLNKLLNSACKALAEISREDAHEIAKEASSLRAKAKDIREGEALRGNVVIFRVIDSLDRIAGYLIDISEAIIDISTIRSISLIS
jgi:phosphate uptake regulator